MRFDLSGEWTLSTEKQSEIKAFLPGTLDENKVGDPDIVAKPWHPDVEDRNKKLNKTMEETKVITSRLTRNYTYEGPAHFSKVFDGQTVLGKRYFLVAERARTLSLKIDDSPIECISGSLSTPYVFEVTGKLRSGCRIELISDNSYPGLPYRDIVFSSAATDESQTNWNGIIGNIFIEEKPQTFISGVTVYPMEKELEIAIELCFGRETDNVAVKVSGKCLTKDEVFRGIGAGLGDESGTVTVRLPRIALNEDALNNKWDEYRGRLQTVKVSVMDGSNADGEPLSEYTANFGVRSFSYDEEGRLTLNGRRIFLRSEANCAYFPETGHPPMDEVSWEKIVKTYIAYGVNCLRFHSWCPPEAAFRAADKLGVLMQPELSHWNPRQAFGTEESRRYYETEMREILRTYGNHPSFVMLTWGNELQADDAGIGEMHRLLDIAHRLDKTRLFAWGSNNFYGANGTDSESDFFTSARYKDRHIRESGTKGIFNTRYASSDFDFEYVMEDLRKEYNKPVFSFEVGQYEILPDFDEIETFKGVTRADNLAIVRDRVKELGITDEEWKKRVNATGEISLLSYREEVEAVMRTKSMSGISLLGLQDFPGQGTALVGMLNTHLQKKPFDFAQPKRFNAFFRESAVLALFPKYTYTNNETFKAEIKVANYGKDDICGKIYWKLVAADGSEFARGVVASEGAAETSEGSAKGKPEQNPSDNSYPVGDLTPAGNICIDLGEVKKNTRFNLELNISGCDISNTYPVWVYSCEAPIRPEGIYETEFFDDRAKEVLSKGGMVYLTPPSTKEALPNSIKAQFSTDFWSVGTFPNQEGAMGQLIDDRHPIFKEFGFPTEGFTNYQWWPMATQRAIILPKYMDTIVTEMDCYAYLRPMTQLMEVKCGGGKLMISSMGLQNLQKYPEARALLGSIYAYMDSDKFMPSEEMSAEAVESLFQIKSE
ncbi:MAG: hypothetical protein IJJ64_10885 [Butyrivibrio sp.]|nr:hypothetical protein [Butyrivibrio sp.]